MPIKSQAQWRYLAARHPELFRRFLKKTRKKFQSLPEHADEGREKHRRRKALSMARRRLKR